MIRIPETVQVAGLTAAAALATQFMTAWLSVKSARRAAWREFQTKTCIELQDRFIEMYNQVVVGRFSAEQVPPSSEALVVHAKLVALLSRLENRELHDEGVTAIGKLAKLRSCPLDDQDAHIPVIEAVFGFLNSIGAEIHSP